MTIALNDSKISAEEFSLSVRSKYLSGNKRKTTFKI